MVLDLWKTGDCEKGKRLRFKDYYCDLYHNFAHVCEYNDSYCVKILGHYFAPLWRYRRYEWMVRYWVKYMTLWNQQHLTATCLGAIRDWTNVVQVHKQSQLQVAKSHKWHVVTCTSQVGSSRVWAQPLWTWLCFVQCANSQHFCGILKLGYRAFYMDKFDG